MSNNCEVMDLSTVCGTTDTQIDLETAAKVTFNGFDWITSVPSIFVFSPIPLEREGEREGEKERGERARDVEVSLLADRCSPSSEAMEYVGGVELAADKMTG